MRRAQGLWLAEFLASVFLGFGAAAGVAVAIGAGSWAPAVPPLLWSLAAAGALFVLLRTRHRRWRRWAR